MAAALLGIRRNDVHATADDYGGKIELSTQQLRNLITLLVSDEFWTITGL